MMDITAKSRHQDQISSGIDHNRPARTQCSGNMPVHKESVHRLMSKPHLNGITRHVAGNADSAEPNIIPDGAAERLSMKLDGSRVPSKRTP